MAIQREIVGSFKTLLSELPTELSAKYPIADMESYLTNAIHLLDVRDAVVRKPTARQNQNEKVKETLLAELSFGTKYTVSDIMTTFPEIAKDVDMSTNRMSALLRQMHDAGNLEADKVKGKSVYWLP